jgi:hypothetical protein
MSKGITLDYTGITRVVTMTVEACDISSVDSVKMIVVGGAQGSRMIGVGKTGRRSRVSCVIMTGVAVQTVGIVPRTVVEQSRSGDPI